MQEFFDEDQGRGLPAGSRGVVVGVRRARATYEVEFARPAPVLGGRQGCVDLERGATVPAEVVVTTLRHEGLPEQAEEGLQDDTKSDARRGATDDGSRPSHQADFIAVEFRPIP